MSSITKESVLVAACLMAVMPAATAGTITLTGEGLTIRYEDKAREVFGAPSLIATSLMSSPASFAAEEPAAAAFPAVAGGAAAGSAPSVSALARDELPRSFAEGVALRFALDDAGADERGLYALLLAGLGLFGLIARQRLAALLRSPQSHAFR